jgi:hypothetical protein
MTTKDNQPDSSATSGTCAPGHHHTKNAVAPAPQAATPLPEQDERASELIAKLDRVARWIDKFPVPTDGATAMILHLRDVKVWIAENLTALTQQAAPVAPRDHEIRELVNDLRDIATQFHAAQQLRARIADRVSRFLVSPVAAPEAPTEPIYQVQFYGNSDSSAWNDASEAAYHMFMPARRRIVYASTVAAPEAPIPMILHCPRCTYQHVDEPDERTEGWANPPHRSHLCHWCGHIWRPADVPTEGVKAIQTRGTNDSAPEAPASEQQAILVANEEGIELAIERRDDGKWQFMPTCFDGTRPRLNTAATTASASDMQDDFEKWAKSHGDLPLDHADDQLKTDDGLLHFPTYKFGRTEIAWRAWANRHAPAPSRETAVPPVRPWDARLAPGDGAVEVRRAMEAEIADLRAAIAGREADDPCRAVLQRLRRLFSKGVDPRLDAVLDEADAALAQHSAPQPAATASIVIDGRTYTADEIKARIQSLDAEAQAVWEQHELGAARLEALEDKLGAPQPAATDAEVGDLRKVASAGEDFHIGVSVEPNGTYVQLWDGETKLYAHFHEMPSKPSAEVGDEGLPPLPKAECLHGDGVYGYTAEQYRQGQREAIAADRRARQIEVDELRAELADLQTKFEEQNRAFFATSTELQQAQQELARRAGSTTGDAELDVTQKSEQSTDVEPDPLYDEAVAIVRAHNRASLSLVQRTLLIGYNRTARLFEAMEAAGVVSRMSMDGHRTVLATPQPPAGDAP